MSTEQRRVLIDILRAMEHVQWTLLHENNPSPRLLQITPDPAYNQANLKLVLVHPFFKKGDFVRRLLYTVGLPHPEKTWIGRLCIENDWVVAGHSEKARKMAKYRLDVCATVIYMYDHVVSNPKGDFQRAVAAPIFSLFQGHLAERNLIWMIMDYVRAPYAHIYGVRSTKKYAHKFIT